MEKLKIVWLSDLHCDFLSEDRSETFMATLRGAKADAIVITGDISLSNRLYRDLAHFGKIESRIYFVLGNHDNYKGSFASTSAEAERAEDDFPNLCWLGERLVVTLQPGLALIGHGGWGDGRAGVGSNGTTMMNDFVLIEDLRKLEGRELFAKLGELGDESARAIQATAEIALQSHDHLLIATHVPPFALACRHRGLPCDPAFLPHYCNVALGDVLIALAAQNPTKNFTVLCGHTHSQTEYQPAPNLWIKVAPATYGKPEIADTLYL